MASVCAAEPVVATGLWLVPFARALDGPRLRRIVEWCGVGRGARAWWRARVESLQPPREPEVRQRPEREAQADCDRGAAEALDAPPLDAFHLNTTRVPGRAHCATRCTSQLVSRTHPCDCT